MAPSTLLSISVFFFFYFTGASIATATPITLPLHRHLPTPLLSSAHPLSLLSASSLLRSSLLKHTRPSHASNSTPISLSPLTPHSYGGYSFYLSFGSPPQQPTPLLLDSGSHLSWLPCTPSYLCSHCPSPLSSPPSPLFLPKSSSSARLIGCGHPSCLWIHRSPNCTTSAASGRIVCPPYLVIYGSGSTAGLLMADVMSNPDHRTVSPNFVFGCSLVSDHQPPCGLAGFGRGAPSFPSQLNVSRFSYCLLSRRFDDDGSVSGSLVLGVGDDYAKDAGMQFAPFAKNPGTAMPYSVYYYLALRKITVGGKSVKLPYAVLLPSSRGGGGVIVDSGTTFTYLSPPVFAAVSSAFVSQIGRKYSRSPSTEESTGLRPCFSLPSGEKEIELPEMSFHFKGGAKWQLPLENYFVVAEPEAGGSKSVCLAMITDVSKDSNISAGDGPAVIIGSFQQQNYVVVYDLEKERLGFKRQSCSGN